MLSPKIFRPQFNRFAMRRSLHRALPGLKMFGKRLRRRRAFCRDHAFEGREPMVVVGFAGVGIAGGLGFFNFLAKHRGPLGPDEQTFFVQRQRHGERMGFPGRAKDWAVCVARNAGNGFGGAPRGFWFKYNVSDMFEIRFKGFDGDFRLWLGVRAPELLSIEAHGVKPLRIVAFTGGYRIGKGVGAMQALDDAYVATRIARQARVCLG